MLLNVPEPFKVVPEATVAHARVIDRPAGQDHGRGAVDCHVTPAGIVERARTAEIAACPVEGARDGHAAGALDRAGGES